MPKSKFLSRLAVAAACWGAVAMPTDMFAADKAAKTTAPKTAAPKSSVSDVALSEGGALVGKVVNAQGKTMDGAVVTISQGQKQVARVVTDDKGAFTVTEMRGGVYQIKAGDGTSVYRVWTAEAAPPSARPQALVVTNPQVVRGQGGGGGLGLVGAGLGAVGAGLGGYALSESQDAKDEADKANQQNALLQQQLNQALASPP